MNDGTSSLVEVILSDPDKFLLVKETLTRIGVPSHKEKKLYQSAHILHKRGKYYIVHFKELFILDGKPSSLDSDDIARRNTIAKLLEDWGLVKIVHPDMIHDRASLSSIKIVSFGDKRNWDLVVKYTIGIRH
jgi:hypothetical protein